MHGKSPTQLPPGRVESWLRQNREAWMILCLMVAALGAVFTYVALTAKDSGYENIGRLVGIAAGSLAVAITGLACMATSSGRIPGSFFGAAGVGGVIGVLYLLRS